MSEIAKAYVQIVPSAKGIKQGLSGIFGSEMPAAGDSAGSIFGSALVGKIKGVIAGAGFGALLKAALTSGADLEQSLGGIETLFKESAATVIANAERAYRTAGVSANGYMEQVTSFSASLLQSLSGDTAKAAAVADMAMTDMSDNANKMGTDMERIADAYQGFAKQNYTMLDNLKLGYGGTKTEMERLLADAEKLTGIKYDITNLSDVYSAIHVIQGELGITGTTALEAASTLTGSFNAMKAAATDVLGNLALGKSIEPSLKALAETTSNFLLKNLVPAVWNIITALPGALVTFINAALPDNVGSVVSTMVNNLTAFVTDELPSIFNDGAMIISEIGTGFLDGIPNFLTTAAGPLLNKLLNAVLDACPSLLESGISLVINLAQGLLNSVPRIISAGASILGDLLSTIASHLPDLLAQGIALVGKLVAGLISEIPNVISAAGDLVSGAVDTFLSFDWMSVGSDLINGIVQGIKNGVGAIIRAARDAAQSALSAAKKALGIASPSRRGRDEVGKQYPAGIALGIRDNAKLVYNAVDDMGENMLKSSLRIGSRLSVSGSAAQYGRAVNVIQNIYSEAKTAADLMQEARYQQELAVMFGV